MSIIIPANSAASGGYEVDNSARFQTASLKRSAGSKTNATKATISMWFKRSELVDCVLMQSYTDDSNRAYIKLLGDTFYFFDRSGGTTENYWVSTFVLRDVSAFYHLHINIDTGNGTVANRFIVHLNGVNQPVANFTNNATYGSGVTSNWQQASGTNQFTIGANESVNDQYFGGYMSEVVYLDGQVVAYDSFGEFDEDSGIWKPIDVSGLTFGTNGFYLDFEDSANLGNDANGGTDLTEYNFTATDQSTDTCTNNFATINILDSFYEASTFSEGNLKIITESSLYSYNTSTIGLTQGKWYCEVFIETSPHPSTKDSMIGIAGRMSEGNDNFLGQSSDTYGIYGGSGQIFNNGSPTSYGVSQTTNDIVGIYMDLDNNKLYFAKNGSLMNSGTGFNLLASNLTTAGAYFMVAADYGNGYQGTYRLNFGNPIYALSSANTDVNGYGSFEYDPSSGTFDGASKDFLAICTKNLSEVLS